MEKFYTTGEVAKVCHISMRTVQYYDKYDLVKPSQMSDGGRRMYSKNDIREMEIVLLYKELGFSLDEIKDIVTHKDINIIADYIQKKKMILNQEISRLQDKQKHLNILDEELKNHNLDIDNLKKLKDIVHKYDDYKSSEKKLYLYLIGYTLILFIGAYILSYYRQIGMGIYLVIMFVLLLLLIGYHQNNNAYICPTCKRKFSITFLKDMLSLNNGKKGKILRCPYCGYKGNMKETYR